MLEQNGGKCPENIYQGFNQKTGQCWNDAILTTLIYGGLSSDIILPKIIENNKVLVHQKLATNLEFLPNNIDKPYYKKFAEKVIEYINFLSERTRNMLTKVDIDVQKGEDYKLWDKILEYYYKGQPIKMKDRESRRRMSAICSFELVNSIIELYSHNRKDEKLTIKDGGSIDIELWTINLFNFLFLDKNLFIRPNYLSFHETHKAIIPDDLLNNCFGILISFSDNIDDESAHMVSLFKCNDEYWIYDDNGIIMKNITLLKKNWYNIIKKDGYINLKNIFPSYKTKKNIYIDYVIILENEILDERETYYPINLDEYIKQFNRVYDNIDDNFYNKYKYYLSYAIAKIDYNFFLNDTLYNRNHIKIFTKALQNGYINLKDFIIKLINKDLDVNILKNILSILVNYSDTYSKNDIELLVDKYYIKIIKQINNPATNLLLLKLDLIEFINKNDFIEIDELLELTNKYNIVINYDILKAINNLNIEEITDNIINILLVQEKGMIKFSDEEILDFYKTYRLSSPTFTEKLFDKCFIKNRQNVSNKIFIDMLNNNDENIYNTFIKIHIDFIIENISNILDITSLYKDNIYDIFIEINSIIELCKIEDFDALNKYIYTNKYNQNILYHKIFKYYSIENKLFNNLLELNTIDMLNEYTMISYLYEFKDVKNLEEYNVKYIHNKITYDDDNYENLFIYCLYHRDNIAVKYILDNSTKNASINFNMILKDIDTINETLNSSTLEVIKKVPKSKEAFIKQKHRKQDIKSLMKESIDSYKSAAAADYDLDYDYDYDDYYNKYLKYKMKYLELKNKN